MRILITLLLLSGASCAHRGAIESDARSSVAISSKSARAATSNELARSLSRVSPAPQASDQSTIVFASHEPAGLAKSGRKYAFHPAIAIQRAKGQGTEFVSWPKLEGYDWVSAASSSDGKHAWGFLEHSVEGPGWEILVLWSEDGGRSWSQLPSLRKHHFSDVFHSFAMTAQGKGQAALRRTGEGDDGRRGFDVFVTLDFGRSWSHGEFVASDIVVEEASEECVFGMEPTVTIPAECRLSFGQ